MEPVTGKITLPDNDAYMEPLACVTAAVSIDIFQFQLRLWRCMHASCSIILLFLLFVVVVVVDDDDDDDDDDNSPSAICNIYSLNNDVPTSKISMN
jgi:hypothetical protein